MLAAVDHVQLAAPPGSEDRLRGYYTGVLGMAEIPKPPVLAARGGTLSEQLDRLADDAPARLPLRRQAAALQPSPALAAPDLEFFNGLGGFARDGQEYVTLITPGQLTPAPWINVIANREFGFQVSADGAPAGPSLS